MEIEKCKWMKRDRDEGKGKKRFMNGKEEEMGKKRRNGIKNKKENDEIGKCKRKMGVKER